ncbi:hypothetical protein HY637_04900 [Candidatus Woesearchaeota archaeon]|nr:hypothetical protein [Candidatus Woesearchaeota archaeon]
MKRKDKNIDRYFVMGLIVVAIVGFKFGWVIGIMFATILGFLYKIIGSSNKK